MAKSQNGWATLSSVSTKLAPFDWVTGKVRKGDVTVVLGYVAAQFNSRVERITKAHSWGYAARNIRGSSASISNHASGTAIDLNAPKHPLGKRNTFSNKQEAAIRAILRELDGVVRWGGDYSGRKDEMHFEINAGSAKVAAVANKIRRGSLSGTKTQKPSINLPNVRHQAKKGGPKALPGVKRIQKRLNAVRGSSLTVDGRYGPGTKKAFAAYQRAIGGKRRDGVPTLWSLTKLVGGKYRITKG